MKFRACFLLIIWSILLLEPLSANFSSIKSVYSSCTKKSKASSSCSKPKLENSNARSSCRISKLEKPKATSSCSKSKCGKPEKKEEKDDCKNNECNPLLSCPTGNFYFFGYTALSIDAFIPKKQKTVLVNDNRILKYMAECWHPPEVI